MPKNCNQVGQSHLNTVLLFCQTNSGLGFLLLFKFTESFLGVLTKKEYKIRDSPMSWIVNIMIVLSSWKKITVN